MSDNDKPKVSSFGSQVSTDQKIESYDMFHFIPDDRNPRNIKRVHKITGKEEWGKWVGTTFILNNES